MARRSSLSSTHISNSKWRFSLAVRRPRALLCCFHHRCFVFVSIACLRRFSREIRSHRRRTSRGFTDPPRSAHGLCHERKAPKMRSSDAIASRNRDFADKELQNQNATGHSFVSFFRFCTGGGQTRRVLHKVQSMDEEET